MKTYDLERFVKLTTLLSKPVDMDTLFDVILKEAMLIGNCDGGTIYTVEKERLVFRYVYTISKGFAANYKTGAESIPPVPLKRTYAAAFAAMCKLRLNLKDVYKSQKFDFSGARKYDEMNGYRTKSMLVVPMLVGGGDVVGVLQLINARDKDGLWTNFTQEQETLVSAVGSIAAFYLENLKLKGMIKDMVFAGDEEDDDLAGYEEEDTAEDVSSAGSTMDFFDGFDFGGPKPAKTKAPAKKPGTADKSEKKDSSKGSGFWTFKV